MTTHVGVIGLGLMGGSLLRRLTAHRLPETHVAGWDCDPQTRAGAENAGLAVAPSLGELAVASDLLFVAVPLPELSGVFTEIAGAGDHAAVVSDLTSVKEPVRDLAAAYEFTFVGGHPMAGTEQSGFAASTVDLLAGAAYVLTLDEETDVAAWLSVAGLVTSIGCQVVPCTSPEHDSAVARVSHLPHVLAAALTAAAADSPLALGIAAGSFRDATRVAATRPELISAMCGGNAEAVGSEIAALRERLDEAQAALRDPARLTAWFSAAGHVRSNWPPAATEERRLAIDAHLPDQMLAAGRAGGHLSSVTGDQVVLRIPPAQHVGRD